MAASQRSLRYTVPRDERVLPKRRGGRGGLGGAVGSSGVSLSSLYRSPESGTAATCFGRGRTRRPGALREEQRGHADAHGEGKARGSERRGREVWYSPGIEEFVGGNGGRWRLQLEQPDGDWARVFEGKRRGGAGVFVGGRGGNARVDHGSNL